MGLTLTSGTHGGRNRPVARQPPAMGIPGIILAAGASRRMGSPKALLQLEGRSFVEIAVELLAAAGIHPLVAVTRAELADPVTARVGNRARVAVNPDPDQGMSSSLLVGLDALEALGAGGTADGTACPGFVLLLVDLPRVSVEVVRHLAEVFSRNPGRIVLPSHGPQGRGGHPVFFPWECVAELRALPLDQGPNVVVRRDPDRVMRIQVAEVGCFDDVDTPDDLRRLLLLPSHGGNPATGP